MKTLFQILFVIVSTIMLTSCGLMPPLSGEAKSATAASPAQPPKQNCSQWCHNGWCSTHCEDVVTS